MLNGYFAWESVYRVGPYARLRVRRGFAGSSREVLFAVTAGGGNLADLMAKFVSGGEVAVSHARTEVCFSSGVAWLVW
jgi:hypothetical protein